MARYKQGDNKRQRLLFPLSLDEYVEILNIAKLKLDKKLKNSLNGQKAYNPKLFLKIYIYG